MRTTIQGYSLLAGSAIVAIAALAPMQAHAQQAAQADADASTAEIVVTAQNRSQKINDVPIAINVISGEDLKKVASRTSTTSTRSHLSSSSTRIRAR